MVKSNISENIDVREIEIPQTISTEEHLQKKPNAYYLRNSQYLRKDERDPALVRSYQRDGYLVPITHPEVLEKYQERFSFELIYDSILDETSSTQKLFSAKKWKKDEQRIRFLEINKRCLQLGLKIKESKNHSDPYLRNHVREYEELGEQLETIDIELNYQKLISKNENWEIPICIPDGLTPVKPFNQEMLPEAIKGWILDISERMQIPPDFSASSCIVVLSSLIGRKIGIFPKRKDDWLVIPNLWGAVVGRPSLLKSPAIAEIMKPLNSFLENASKQYQNKTAVYEQELMLQEAKKSALKDLMKQSVKKAAKSGSTLDIQQCYQKNHIQNIEKPTLKRYKTEDSTIEKISEILKENPQGLLIHRDELFGWLKSLDKYGREGDRAFYLEAWNGNGGFTVDRIGRGTLEIPALCLSILGGIQPGPLSSYIYQASKGGVGDDGLLQRFQLLVWPDPPKKWINVDRFPDNESKHRAYRVYQGLDALSFEHKNRDLNGLRFSDEAQYKFDEWRNKLELRLRNEQLAPAVESHLAKFRSLMPSLSLIFYLIECVDQGLESSKVTLNAASQAIAWCEYLESHMLRLYSSAQRPELESAKALMSKIKKGEIQDKCSLRDVYYGKHWVHLSNRKEVDDAVNILQELGWLRVMNIATRGRPTQIIRLNPFIKK